MTIKQLKTISVVRKTSEFAMPYLIEGTYIPSWAETEGANRKFLELLKTRNPKVLKRHVDGDETWILYQAKHNGNQLIWVEDQDLIQYCVEVKQLKLEGVNVKTVCQTSVWRNKSFVGLYGFAKWVFYKVLYPINHSILSDSYQYADGKNFWGHRINEALKQNYLVYAVSMIGDTVCSVYNLNPITSVRQLETYYTKDDDLSGDKHRFLIVKEPVKLDFE